jgi:hypothetical protein
MSLATQRTVGGWSRVIAIFVTVVYITTYTKYIPSFHKLLFYRATLLLLSFMRVGMPLVKQLSKTVKVTWLELSCP